MRLNTTHLVLVYCSCLPQIPKQTSLHAHTHITHKHCTHTHTHRNSHPLGVLLDSSSSDAREALAWEKETQSCVTFIHSKRGTHTHTVRERVFVCRARGQALSSALILTSTVKSAPETGGLSPEQLWDEGLTAWNSVNSWINWSAVKWWQAI